MTQSSTPSEALNLSPAAQTALMMVKNFDATVVQGYGVDEQRICRCKQAANCGSPGKHPRGGYREHAFITTANHKAIFTADGSSNWLLPLGGLIVGLDDDTSDHTGFQAVEDAISDTLRPTAIIRTGSDHRTRLYRAAKKMPQRIALLKTSSGHVEGPPGVVLPDSRSGTGDYSWEKSPLVVGIAPLQPKLADFILRKSEANETQNCNPSNLLHETQELNSVSHCLPLSPFCVSGGSDLRRLIQRCVPDQYGFRWHSLFRLARGARAHPQYANCTLADLEPLLQEWYRLAYPSIRTKDIKASRRDLWEGYKRVKFAGGTQGRLASMVNPSFAQQPLKNRLQELCANLQESAGDEPFFLACRSAAEVLGVGHQSVARLLKELVAEGVIKLVTKGKRRAAAEYRYVIANDEENS